MFELNGCGNVNDPDRTETSQTHCVVIACEKGIQITEFVYVQFDLK